MPSLPPDDLRDLLAGFLQRVIIQENHVQIMVSRTDLRELLEKGDRIIAAKLLGTRNSVPTDDIICLTIEAKRKRYGGEIHLVVPPNASSPIRHPRPALIKAVARGHAWYESPWRKSRRHEITSTRDRTHPYLRPERSRLRLPCTGYCRGHPGRTSAAHAEVRTSVQVHPLELD